MQVSSKYQVPNLKLGEVLTHELVIKRSRFITSIAHTRGMEEAKAFISKIQTLHSSANHNCYAFNADKPGSTAICGCSDDGEPHGTAGQPMLNVVLHCGIGEITCVVTRYFGGILLGTGGLVKAYQDSVKEALLKLQTCECIIPSYVNLTLDHRYITQLLRLIRQYQGEIVESKFEVRASYRILLPFDLSAEFMQRVHDLTQGQVTLYREGDN